MSTYLGPYQLGWNTEWEAGIYTGDAKELARDIPDESVDLIFADPIYENVDDYEWLAIIASRILKPNRACLAWVSTPLMPEVINVMHGYLDWAWCLYWNRSTDVKFYPGRAGITVITPCLWFEKGKSEKHANYADYVLAGWDDTTSNHQWSKPRRVVEKWTTLLSARDAVVFDPFCGGGTVPVVCKLLNRQYLGFEIDPVIANSARKRLYHTQPPLTMPDTIDQLELIL